MELKENQDRKALRVVFVLAMTMAVRRWPHVFWLAPVACILAKLCTAGLQAALGDTGVTVLALQHSLTRALSGIIVLGAIHPGLSRFFPKDVK